MISRTTHSIQPTHRVEFAFHWSTPYDHEVAKADPKLELGPDASAHTPQNCWKPESSAAVDHVHCETFAFQNTLGHSVNQIHPRMHGKAMQVLVRHVLIQYMLEWRSCIVIITMAPVRQLNE